MKKFQGLGKVLSKEEQRKIMGGVDDGPLCGNGRVGDCSCGGPHFFCCIECPSGNVAAGCLTQNGCPVVGSVCSHTAC